LGAAICGTFLSVTCLSPALGNTSVSWLSPVSGNWTDANMWTPISNYPQNGVPVPGTQYDVFVDEAGPTYQINLQSAGITISNLTLNAWTATLRSDTATLSVLGEINVNNGTLQLGSGTLSNATLKRAGNGTIDFFGGMTFQNVTIDTDLQTRYLSRIRDGLTILPGRTLTLGTGTTSSFQQTQYFGVQTIGGGGTLLLSSGALQQESGSLTLASDLKVRSVLGSSSIVMGSDGVNNAHVVAAANSTLSIGYYPWTNNGTLQSDAGATLYVGMPTTNNGTILINGGRLVMQGGNITASSLGTFINNGGQVDITGTFNNAGNTIILDATRGSWGLGLPADLGAWGYCNGGTIVTTSGQWFGTRAQAHATLYNGTIVGTLHSDGMLYSNGVLTIDGMLEGAGTIAFDTGPQENVIRQASGTLTIGAGLNVVSGYSGGTVGIASLPMTNYGILSAVGRALEVNASTLTNTGTLRATGTGTLTVNVPGFASGTFESGTLKVEEGGHIYLPGAHIEHNYGTISLYRSGGGIFSDVAKTDALTNFAHNGPAATFALQERNFTTAGDFSNEGTVSLRGASLTINGNLAQISGDVLTGGKWIIGGSLNLGNGQVIRTNQADINFISQVKITSIRDNQGTITLSEYASFWLASTLTNSGSIYIKPGCTLQPSFARNLISTGTLQNDGLLNFSGGNGTLTSLAGFGALEVHAAAIRVGKLRQGSVLFYTNGTLTLDSPGASPVVNQVGSIAFYNPARVDLTNEALVIDYEGASPFASILGNLTSGFAGGAWNGMGIMSSVAATSSDFDAIGFAEANALGTTSFLGQPVDGTVLLLRYTYAGDANLDGAVNTIDFNALAGSFGQGGKSWIDGDSNYSGAVDSADFNLLAANFGLSTPLFKDLGKMVPEPSLAGLLSGVVLIISGRKRS
jgi:hypothetical protein